METNNFVGTTTTTKIQCWKDIVGGKIEVEFMALGLGCKHSSWCVIPHSTFYFSLHNSSKTGTVG